MRSSSNITIQNQSYFPNCHSKSDGIKLLINRFAAQNVNLNYSVTHYQDFYNIHRVRNCYLIFLLGDVTTMTLLAHTKPQEHEGSEKR